MNKSGAQELSSIQLLKHSKISKFDLQLKKIKRCLVSVKEDIWDKTSPKQRNPNNEKS